MQNSCSLGPGCQYPVENFGRPKHGHGFQVPDLNLGQNSRLRRSVCVRLSLDPEGRNMGYSSTRISALILVAAQLPTAIHYIFYFRINLNKFFAVFLIFVDIKLLGIRKPKYPSFIFFWKANKLGWIWRIANNISKTILDVTLAQWIFARRWPKFQPPTPHQLVEKPKKNLYE